MKRFNPMFYRLALANLFFFLGNSLFILFPVFLKNMGASESYIGFMNNIDKVFVIITAVSISSIMQGRDMVRLLRAGYVILIGAYVSYLLISDLSWAIAVIRVVHGIGFSVSMILGTTIIFDIVSMEDATEAIGIYGITGALSNAVSPFVGEMLLARGFPHSVIFILSAVLVAASLSVTFFMPPQKRHGGDHVPLRGSPLALLGDPKFLLLSVVTLIFGGMFGVIVTYLPNFVRTTTGFQFSWFFIVYIGVLIMIRFTFLRSINRVNRNILLAAMFLIGTVANLCLNFLYWIWVLVLVGVLYGITHGFLYPVLNTMTVGIVAERDRGKANALFTAVFNTGMMTFAIGLGHLIDRTGTYLSAFNFSAAASLGALVFIALLGLRYGPLPVPRVKPPASTDEFDV